MERVYYYTSMAVFQSLLQNIQIIEGKPHFMFWASNIFYMNDPQEFYYGHEMLMKVLEKLEYEWNVEDRFCVSKIWDQYTSNDKEEWGHILLNEIHKQGGSPYVISFSQKEDYLPMWVHYANRGKGVCMAFADYRNTPIVKDKMGKDYFEIIDDLHTSTVCYEDFEETESPMETIRKMYVSYLDKIYLEKDENIIFQKKLGLLAGLTRFCAPRLKTMHYRYESEKRIIRLLSDNDLSKIKFRTNVNGNIVPYIEVPIPCSQLDYVIIGPCANYELTESAIDLMKTRYNLEFEMKKTSVKYRLY